MALSALTSPSSGVPPPHTHGPRRPISAQPGVVSLCLSNTVGVPLSCPAFWMDQFCSMVFSLSLAISPAAPDWAGGTLDLFHYLLCLWPLPVPLSAHRVQTLQDCTQWERAQPALAAGLAPGLSPTHRAAPLLLCHDNVEPQRALGVLLEHPY